MEPVWNGILTCDYERTRPDSSLLGWDLYTKSLIMWPMVLMGEPTPYGGLRRPGIVDIPQEVHECLAGLWHARLADPGLVAGMIATTGQDRHDTSAALEACEDAISAGSISALSTAAAAATAAFLRVYSTHIVNWLLPERHWETLLTGLLGTRSQALTCLAALQLPDNPGHILAACRCSSSAGNQGSHLAVSARSRARQRRDAWRLAALLAAGDQPVLTEIRALPAVLGWAANCEERRNELRSRYMAAIGAWCMATGHDPGLITTADLTGEVS